LSDLTAGERDCLDRYIEGLSRRLGEVSRDGLSLRLQDAIR
jgi:hypothetical protein